MVTSKKRSLLILAIAFLIQFYPFFNLNSQELEVTARVDSNKYLIGDWIKLYIDLKYKTGIKIHYPTILDSINGLELIERAQPTINKKGDLIRETLTFTFTAFDSGLFIIPQLNFIYSVENDTTKKISTTNPILIFVEKIKVDPEKDIKDIKPPFGIPISIFEILKYVLILIIVSALVFLGYYLYKNRKEKNILDVFKGPKRPPHEIALEALQTLAAEHLWQRGEVKLYHSKLTDIVRAYIEERFYSKALESTTDEIILDLDNKEIDKTTISKLKELLTRADLVKFAKAQPTAEENERSLQLAFEFVNETILKEQTEDVQK